MYAMARVRLVFFQKLNYARVQDLYPNKSRSLILRNTQNGNLEKILNARLTGSCYL
jgi:hypothetical protein